VAGADFGFTGEITGDSAGDSIASAGDVDGDGLDDLVFGVESNDDVDTGSGKAFVILASSLDPGSPTMSLSDADMVITGVGKNDRTGATVASAGDLDGDGLDDVLVGAYGYGNSVGAVGVFLGSTLTATTDMDFDEADYLITTSTSSELIGFSLSGNGDVDGDGVPDLLYGSTSDDTAEIASGAVMVHLGAHIDADTASTDFDYKYIGDTELEYVGTSACWVGDVDGDGVDDFLSGTSYIGSGLYSGTVWLITDYAQ
jgi:hypothetical protein